MRCVVCGVALMTRCGDDEGIGADDVVGCVVLEFSL